MVIIDPKIVGNDHCMSTLTVPRPGPSTISPQFFDISYPNSSRRRRRTKYIILSNSSSTMFGI